MGGRVSTRPQEADGEGEGEDEPVSFSKLFHKVEPFYLSIGMTYDQFWHGDVWLVKVYREAETMRAQRANVEAWRNGFYMISALNSTVCNVFRKKGFKPVEYMDRPLPITQAEKDEYERQKQADMEEQIKRMMFSMMGKDGDSED